MLTFKSFLLENAMTNDQWENFKNWMPWPRKQQWPKQRNILSDYHVKVTPGHGNLEYMVYHKKKKQHVGRFWVRSNTHNGSPVLSVMNASVDEKHQRKGIGTAVYRMIENDTKSTGLTLYPHGKEEYETTSEAKAFWRKYHPERAKEVFGS